ncbi:MAG: transposase, partial [Candidatus Marinimicrobia bacterium]|nr:transposase [Candidatus Neomarinimicrobiota bacterium]
MGGYFITACTQNRKILFDKEPVQKLIEKWWWELANKFPTIELDAFVIMPNHIHGIIFLKGIEENIGVAFDRKLEDDDTADVGVD